MSRDDEAFDHQLTDDREAAATQRHAGGNLLATGAAASDQQRCDVDACDDEDGGDSPAEHDDRLPGAGHDRILQARQHQAPLCCSVGPQHRERRGSERAELGICLLERHAIPQARHHRVVESLTDAPERHPDRGLGESFEAIGHDANNGEGLAAEEDRLPDRVCTTLEDALPEAKRQDDDGRSARPRLVAGELASEERRHAQHSEIPIADQLAAYERGPAGRQEADVRGSPDRYGGVDQGRAFSDGRPHRAVDGRTDEFACGRDAFEADDRQTIRFRKRKGAQQYRVGETEDRARGSNHEGERDDDGRVETRGLAQSPYAVAQIASQDIEDGQPIHVIHLLPPGAWIAEAQTCRPGRFGLAHALRHVVVNRLGQMCGDFVVTIAVSSRPPDPLHDVGSMTRATAVASCAHREASVASCFRPLAVSV